MKKIFFLIILIVGVWSSNVFSQDAADTIHIKHALGPVFIKNGKPLKPRQMLEIMKDNPGAYHEMTIARKNYVIQSVIGGIGGFMFGWSLGSALGSGGKINLPLLSAGLGLVGVSIPFAIAYSTHSTKAVKNYNSSILTKL